MKFPWFKAGDLVKITAGTAATGMLDFIEGKAYEVIATTGKDVQSLLLENESREGDWYHSGHFQMYNTIPPKILDNYENLFKVGQVVWDLRNGRGVVADTEATGAYPIKVKFDLADKEGNQIKDFFTKDGRYAETQTVRSLYFSEPKIEGALEPLFESVLKAGEPVILTSDINSQMIAGWVEAETPTTVTVTTERSAGEIFEKNRWLVYRVGEKVEFK